jgi:hypothetical protein
MSNLKHCWTLIHCDWHSKCELPLVSATNGQFQPSNVGEFCDHFVPRVSAPEPHIMHYTPGCEEEQE